MNFIGRHTPLDWVEDQRIENERAVFEYSAVDQADGAVLRVVVRQTQPRRRGVCDWGWSATVDGHVLSCGAETIRQDSSGKVITVPVVALSRIGGKPYCPLCAKRRFRRVNTPNPDCLNVAEPGRLP